MAQIAVQPTSVMSMDEVYDRFPGEWVLMDVRDSQSSGPFETSGPVLYHSKQWSRTHKRLLSLLADNRHLPEDSRPHVAFFEALRPFRDGDEFRSAIESALENGTG